MGLWDGLGSAGLGFLGGLFQGAFNYGAQKEANKTNLQITRETNAANRQLAEYEWNKNLEMWNLQNQYNSPFAQMQRYTDAGLNPNLIYGQGSSGNATNLPRYSAPTMQPVTVSPQMIRLDNALGVLGHYMDYRIKSAQEEQIRAQTENINWTRLNLWPTQTRLWSSQKGYWDANANRLATLLPFEQRNYNSLINTRADQLALGRLRYDLDRQRYMYALDLERDKFKLSKDRFSFDKQVWTDRYDLLKKRFRLDAANSLYPRALNKLQFEFFNKYGVMPNTQLGSELGLFTKLYRDPVQAYSNWFIGKSVVNSLGTYLGGRGFYRKGRPKNGYQGQNTTSTINYL